jgi:dihydrofolate reductase
VTGLSWPPRLSPTEQRHASKTDTTNTTNIYGGINNSSISSIGNRNKIPWRIPEDFKRFKDLTMGKPCIMGRSTYLSILEDLGKPLPGRKNIILSRDINYVINPLHAYLVRSIDEAYDLASKESDLVFVLGGQRVYEQTINLVDKLEITEVHLDVVGDAYFPKIDEIIWKESQRQPRLPSKTGIEYSFVTYTRR